MDDKESLAEAFFRRTPKARKINPIFRAFFDFMYEAHRAARPGTRLLNIYASWDLSHEREELYREKFFDACEYDAVDFREDRFIDEKHPEKNPHEIPFPSARFDIVVTTKYIMEHVSEPQKVVDEFCRVLKPGGEAFIVAPHIRRQHQKPWDFYRYTEFALEHLFRKAGFREITITPTNGFMATVAYYAYFFERGLGLPRWLERIFDLVHAWIIEPVFYTLDRLDNGYGRDMTLYFLVRAKK